MGWITGWRFNLIRFIGSQRRLCYNFWWCVVTLLQTFPSLNKEQFFFCKHHHFAVIVTNFLSAPQWYPYRVNFMWRKVCETFINLEKKNFSLIKHVYLMSSYDLMEKLFVLYTLKITLEEALSENFLRLKTIASY